MSKRSSPNVIFVTVSKEVASGVEKEKKEKKEKNTPKSVKKVKNNEEIGEDEEHKEHKEPQLASVVAAKKKETKKPEALCRCGHCAAVMADTSEAARKYHDYSCCFHADSPLRSTVNSDVAEPRNGFRHLGCYLLYTKDYFHVLTVEEICSFCDGSEEFKDWFTMMYPKSLKIDEVPVINFFLERIARKIGIVGHFVPQQRFMMFLFDNEYEFSPEKKISAIYNSGWNEHGISLTAVVAAWILNLVDDETIHKHMSIDDFKYISRQTTHAMKQKVSFKEVA